MKKGIFSSSVDEIYTSVKIKELFERKKIKDFFDIN